MTRKWPPLPELGELIYSLPDWPYPTHGGEMTRIVHASLRLYEASDGGHVAIVEDTPDPDLLVHDGAEHIWRSLSEDYAAGPITLIELHRHARDGGHGFYFDQYIGEPDWELERWRPMSDIDAAHPDYTDVFWWVTRYRHVIIRSCAGTAFDGLLAASSLASGRAEAIRAQTPPEASQGFQERVQQTEEEA